MQNKKNTIYSTKVVVSREQRALATICIRNQEIQRHMSYETEDTLERCSPSVIRLESDQHHDGTDALDVPNIIVCNEAVHHLQKTH